MGTTTPGPSMDHYLLEQFNMQVNVFEMEMLDISRSIAFIEDAKELPNEEITDL